MLFSKKQAVWRKEKEMKNKVMNILKYFVVSVLIFFFLRDCRYENAFALEFWFSFKGASRLETSCLSSELKLVFLWDFIGR